MALFQVRVAIFAMPLVGCEHDHLHRRIDARVGPDAASDGCTPIGKRYR